MQAANKMWTIHTEVFEGPLDLLLYLVNRDSIDLKNIQISVIADSYLEYLDKMRVMRLNVVSEYLVMAATLVHMKSLRLLPRLPTLLLAEDEEDPAAALARRLLEYQRFKEAAMDIESRPMVGRDVFTRPPESVTGSDQPVEAGVSAFGLLEMYFGLIQQHKAGPPVHYIGRQGPDMGLCCESVLRYLDGFPDGGLLSGLLQTFASIEERLVTFIAVLEMARLQWLNVSQEVHLGPVHLIRRPGAVVDLEFLTGRLQTLDPQGSHA